MCSKLLFLSSKQSCIGPRTRGLIQLLLLVSLAAGDKEGHGHQNKTLAASVCAPGQG